MSPLATMWESDEKQDVIVVLICDASGHGTHCAGVIAGSGYGFASNRCELYVGKVLSDRSNKGSPHSLLEGMKWARDKDCEIISLSVGSGYFNPEVHRVIQKLTLKNVIIVAAAGNQGAMQDDSVSYPATFGDVICVGSHTKHGHASPFSSQGRQIDVLAPGQGIASCVPANFWIGCDDSPGGCSMQ